MPLIFNAEEQYDQAAKFCQELALFTNQLGAFIGLRGMAYAMCGLEDHAAARLHLLKAIEAAVFLKAPGLQAQCLPAAAIIAASEGQTERAAELLALAFHHPASATGWLEKFPLVTRLRASLEADLPPQVFAAAWERGQALDLAETIAILLNQDLD